MARKSPVREKMETRAISHTASGIIGIVLLILGISWVIWILLHQFGGSALAMFPIIGVPPDNGPVVQYTPLVAVGITLSQPDQTAQLNQKQAILIASQLEPDAATGAKYVSSSYVLFNYPTTATPAPHPNFSNAPAWLIIYQKIPVDGTTSQNATYDLYVFLDANSGKELLVVRA